MNNFMTREKKKEKIVELCCSLRFFIDEIYMQMSTGNYIIDDGWRRDRVKVMR